VAQPPSVARAPPTAHAPTGPQVPDSSIAIDDLGDELLCHEGEDGRVTIKRWGERHHNIEARNLERDFSALSPVHELPGPWAEHSPSSPATSEGCMALAPHLNMPAWPRKFQPHLPEKYDRTVNHAEFLQIYSTSILAAGEMKLVWSTTSLWP
jgi:hypothetical protein